MLKKVLLSLILLWATGHLLATPSLPGATIHNIPPCDCTLSPPENLHAIKVGTITADIAWDSVTGADGYKVKVYQKVGINYIFLYEINHFSTTITLTGLIVGSEHRVTIACMCWCNSLQKGWQISPNTASLELPKIILDLDIVQIAPMPTNASLISCSPSEEGCCNYYFNHMNGRRLWIKVRKIDGGACNIHPIRITDGGRVTLFRRTDQTNQCPTTLPTQNIGYQYTTVILDEDVPLTYAVIRLENGHEILRIDAYSSPFGSVESICITNLDSDYEFGCYELSWFGFGPPNGGDRNDLPPTTKPHTYPISPFADQLDVISSSPEDQPSILQLFDMSGRLKVSQHFSTGQSNYSLPTTDLAPGLYILRVESGNEIQTHKVVKTQN